MMLAHPQMDAVLDFDCGKVNTLVIESSLFFRELLCDIHAQMQGYSGKTVLSRNNEPISFSGNAELIDSYLSFEINRKPLITKLLSQIEALAVDETHYIRTSTLMGELEQYLQELSMDLPCNVFCSKMNFGTLLRAVGVSIPDDYENDLERILDFMELTREMDRDKLFIFVNLRSYYSDEDIFRFFASVLSHGYSVLLIDSVARNVLQNETRITIDVDLFEF